MLTVPSIWRVFTPVYFFRPQQIFIRAHRELSGRSQTQITVRLPWGLPIVVNPREALGYNIAMQGLYEPLVAETLWRLAEPKDRAIDVGANIGDMTSVLAARVGPKGRILCFEPHPQVFSRLQSNVASWQGTPACPAFELHPMALGSEDGSTLLHTNDYFAGNMGTAWIGGERDGAHPQATPVQLAQLDTLLAPDAKVGVMKIDVEGAELDVFRGMSRLLADHAVRDIVFEEIAAFPAPTHRFLQDKGYFIFGLEQGFWGIHLLPGAAPELVAGGDPANYLATCDPGRARRLLTPPGWRSFGWTKFFAPALPNGAS